MSNVKPYNLRVRITPDIYQRVKDLAADNSVSQSVVIRSLLIRSLEEVSKTKKPCEKDDEEQI